MAQRHGYTHLDLLGLQGTLLALLLDAFLDALQNILDQFSVVDPKKVGQLGRLAAPNLELRRLWRRVEFGRQRRHGRFRRKRVSSFRLQGHCIRKTAGVHSHILVLGKLVVGFTMEETMKFNQRLAVVLEDA